MKIKKFRKQCRSISKHAQQTKRMLQRKAINIKRQVSTAREKYDIKRMKMKQATKRKEMMFLDMKASALIEKYKGIDNLLAKNENLQVANCLGKDMIHYCVMQYLTAMKQYYGHINLQQILQSIWEILQTKINVKNEKKKKDEEIRRKLEEERQILAEKMQLEIQLITKAQSMKN